MTPFKNMIVNGARQQVHSEIVGSAAKLVLNPITKGIVKAVTVCHPDPVVNRLKLPCDGCPYLFCKNNREDCACGTGCNWYRYLYERSTYNSLPLERRKEAERKFLAKVEKKAAKR